MASRLDSINDWDSLAAQGRFRVDLLAKTCGVCERQLRRYFQRRFGISPYTWMTAKRMDQAKTLLTKGKLVKEVAAEAGFLQPSNFTRQFKRQFNATPTQMRLH
jgi:AraC-like DNA-binding protein